MRYKEAFSRELIEKLLARVQPRSVLDPFSGTGTTPLVAAGKGLRAIGIEIIPVGVLVGKAISIAANGLDKRLFTSAASNLLNRLDSKEKPSSRHSYAHVKITEAAFPAETELDLAKAREFISTLSDPSIYTMLNFACMSVLESVSYTSKDGQYLRWDPRSGKRVRTRLHKRSILGFRDAIRDRLAEMIEDIEKLKKRYGEGFPEFITGSNLVHLRQIPTGSLDMVITSPPYANRYDYTRTYALELAWLGYDDDGIKTLRQSMLSATVENKSKKPWLLDTYEDKSLFESATNMYEGQGAVHEVISQLREHKKELSNPHVIRMLEGYFFEMAVIVAELGRIVRPELLYEVLLLS